MGAALTLDLAGLAPWLADAAVRGGRLDAGRWLKGVALLLEGDTKRHFDEQRGPDGSPWPPLRNPSARRGGAAAAPLRDRGLLAASCVAFGAGHVEEVTPTSLVWGTNLDYAAKQNFGGPTEFPERRRGPGEKPWVFPDGRGGTVYTRRIRAHKVTVPARTFVGIGDGLAADIAAFLAEKAAGHVAG